MESLVLFATDIHVSLKAEPIFNIGSFTVTNSLLYGLVCAIILATVFIAAARTISIKPRKGSSQLIEMVVEFVINLLQGPFGGSRDLAAKYTPVFGTYFIFILFINILGLLPIVGPGLTIHTHEGATPLFRPFTADLNGTIAMAVIAILTVQVLSIKQQGLRGHFTHYFTDKPWNPISFFIGILEVFGELTRVMSLSLRLFLNTAVGEILISVFTSLIAANGRTPFAAIPIILFELLVAGIQAYVFTILAATYLGLSIAHSLEHGEGHDSMHHSTADKNKVEPAGA